VDAAQRIALGLLAATSSFGGRLPELFCGFDRAEYPAPVAYPTSCTPQAWAAATPIQLLRTLLRFDPSVPTGELHVAPALPREFGALRVRGVRVADARITLDVDGDRVKTVGLPPDLKVVT
jgi:glycogen debranching enzyme